MSEPGPVRTPVSLSVLANLLTNRADALTAGLLHGGAVIEGLPDGWVVKATFEIGKQAPPDGGPTLIAEHEEHGVSVLATVQSLVDRVWAVDGGLSDIPPIARYRLTRAFVVYIVEDQRDRKERMFVLPWAVSQIETLRAPGKPPASEVLYRSGRRLDWKAEEVLVEDTLVSEPEPAAFDDAPPVPEGWPAPTPGWWWIGRTGDESYEVFVHAARNLDEMKLLDWDLTQRYYRGLTGPFASHGEVSSDLSARPSATVTWVSEPKRGPDPIVSAPPAAEPAKSAQSVFIEVQVAAGTTRVVPNNITALAGRFITGVGEVTKDRAPGQEVDAVVVLGPGDREYSITPSGSEPLEGMAKLTVDLIVTKWTGRIAGGRPFGQTISTRPSRAGVELMGNPDNGSADDAATIDVIALLMREGWEYHDVMRVLEDMDREVALPEGEDHSVFAIRTWLAGDDTATKSSSSRWPKDAPPPPVSKDDIPF